VAGGVTKSSGFIKNGRNSFFGRYGSEERLRFREEKERWRWGEGPLYSDFPGGMIWSGV